MGLACRAAFFARRRDALPVTLNRCGQPLPRSSPGKRSAGTWSVCSLISAYGGTFRTCRDSLAMSAHRAKQTSGRKAATSVFNPGCAKAVLHSLAPERI
jgi:hypothetical protein